MFFNARSAVLQTLSTVNFINFEDNNIFAASKAFANQKQYWSDFAFIFNSDFLKQRRAGLKTDVSQSEIASAVAGATNKAKAAIAYLLKIGFAPTQAADSFAISAGGATFYRNRLNKYLAEGKTQKEAQEQVTARWEAVMQSDSFLSKNIRPLVLIYLTVIFTVCAFFDGNVGEFKIAEEYIPIFQTLLVTVYGAYFVGRTWEKAKAINKK